MEIIKISTSIKCISLIYFIIPFIFGFDQDEDVSNSYVFWYAKMHVVLNTL
jgi:hypothetical protein